MARRKTLFRLPFFRFRINRKTIFNMFGFLLLGTSLILLVSFFNLAVDSEEAGVVLQESNAMLVEKFGILSIFVPILLFLIALQCFSTKKLKFIKLNITGGLLLILIALLGILQAGVWGRDLYSFLSADFSVAGAVISLSALLCIGLIFFLDTGIDGFILFIIKIISGIIETIQKIFSADPRREDKLAKRPAEGAFIEDSHKDVRMKINEARPLPPALPPTREMMMKPLVKSTTAWTYPPLSILADLPLVEADRGDVKDNAHKIETTLESFAIRARVLEVNKGPTVTQYALQITQGTKLSKITSLSNDLALALAATTGQVRIEAPIPGRSLVGIEIPNIKPEIVTLKRLLDTPVFKENPDPLLVPLGLDVSGAPQAASISRMPHVLIAGTTGSGKSVILNAWISTFLYRTKPDELRLIMVDPKRVELTLYNGIPHLFTEVIVEPDKIISALRWTVAEMETRYKDFAKAGVRNLEGFNALEGVQRKPYIIFVIDELADLMAFAPGDAEDLITRIAQMARATGIHLVLATQRPSVDVITGLMKANIPTRIAFNVSSLIDSRVIIDTPGAEKLLGRGDMLYMPPDQAKPRRIQGPYITEKEVNELVKFLRSQVPEVHYTDEITDKEATSGYTLSTTAGVQTDKDAHFTQAIEVIMQHDKASASLLQRRLSIGYARAARLLDQLEAAGYVSPAEGSKPRNVIRRSAPEQVIE